MVTVSITYNIKLPLLVQKAIHKYVEREKSKGEYQLSIDEWGKSSFELSELSPNEGKVTHITLIRIVIDIDYIPVIPGRKRGSVVGSVPFRHFFQLRHYPTITIVNLHVDGSKSSQTRRLDFADLRLRATPSATR